MSPRSTIGSVSRVSGRSSSGDPGSGAAGDHEVILQRDGVVVALVAGAEQERDDAALDRPAQRRHGARLVVELLRVPLPELLPFPIVVREPSTQLGAWRDVFQP